MLKGLLCPNCRSELETTRDSYLCPACKTTFDIRDGVSILLPATIDSSVQEDIRAWDDNASGRIEHLPPIEALLGLESRMRDFLDHVEWDALQRGRVLEVGGGSMLGFHAFEDETPFSGSVCNRCGCLKSHQSEGSFWSLWR